MSTIIKLTPEQIPQVWEIIKLAAVASRHVPESERGRICNRLLAQLLSGTLQCFVRIDEQRVIQTVFMTQVRVQQITGIKELFVISLYSFKPILEEDAKAAMKMFIEVAKQQQCEQIVCDSAVKRVWEIVEWMGWNELTRYYVYRLEGDHAVLR